MANITGIGLKALKEIIDDRTPSHVVWGSFNQEYNLSKEESSLLRRIVHGSLKHFLLLSYQAQNAFPSFKEDDDETYLVIVTLYELRYLQKSIAAFKAINEAEETSQMMSLRFAQGELNDKLKELSSTPFSFPDSVKKDPYKFNSLFFSVPEWIIKMWAEQYGDEVAMSILKDSLRRHPTYVNFNAKKTTKEEITSLPDYECGEEESIRYVKSGPLSLNEEFKEGKVFIEDLSTQLALKEIETFRGERIIQLHSVSGSIVSDLALRFDDPYSKIESNYDNEMLYRRARYLYQRLGIKQAKAYIGNKDMLLTYCEFNKYDLAISSPSCSYLGQLSKRPSLLATLRKKDLEPLIKEEKENLEFASKYLVDGGTLLYLVPTINKDEGENVVNSFIRKHPEFTLVNSKQIFPYDYGSDGLYFARMIKGQ